MTANNLIYCFYSSNKSHEGDKFIAAPPSSPLKKQELENLRQVNNKKYSQLNETPLKLCYDSGVITSLLVCLFAFQWCGTCSIAL